MDAEETSETPPSSPAGAESRSDQTNVPAYPRNPRATAAGVIAIVALTLRFGPELLHMGYEGIALLLLAIPLGISAIVLGVIGLVRAPSRGDIGRPWALAGILGGFIAAAAALAWLFSPGPII